MRMTVLAGLLALAACQDAMVEGHAVAALSAPPELAPVALPQSDGAGNRLEALSQLGDGGVYCIGAETWCLTATNETSVSVAQDAGAPIALPARGVMWPNIIVSQSSAIAGVIETETQSYSGGGGSAEHLVLFKVADGRATEIARLPYSGSIMIRACFSEENVAARADACHDQYEFVSRVRLDDAVTSGAPQIVLETAAATYPGRVARQADSLERPALTQADLVWATDEMCSFRRTYHATASGPYLPDTELPALYGLSRTLNLPRKPKAVVFDLDGTLIDSEALVKEAHFAACSEMGVAMSDAQFLALVGMHREANDLQLKSYYGDDFPLEDFIGRTRARVGDRVAPLKDGAVELMDALDELALPFGLATSSRRPWVERHFAAHGLTDRFRAVVTRQDCVEGKPHPEPYLNASRLLGAAAMDVLALEDSYAGVASAHGAGCMTVMVPDLLTPSDEQRAQALVMNSLRDVVTLLTSAR